MRWVSAPPIKGPQVDPMERAIEIRPSNMKRFGGWREGGNKREGREQKARGAETGDGTASNESRRVGRGAADGRADEEGEHGSTVDPAYRVTRTQLAKHELRHTDGHQVDTTVPSNVLERMELIRDVRDGIGHDGAVLEKVSMSGSEELYH